MMTAIVWAAACSMFAAFIIWIYRLGKQNEKLDHMAQDQKQRSESAERVASMLVNDDWAERLRNTANRKSKD
jgi:hypothetical protein